MADEELRQLERRWREVGDQAARAAYARGLARSGRDRLWFVYLSGYEGPSRKRVVRLDGCPDALEWFRRGLGAARAWPELGEDERYAAANELVEASCGGHVYGLESVFQRAHERELPVPGSWGDLADLLRQHLYVEGEVIVREPTVRVLTDDDEVTLAYFFFPESWALLHPERTEYLLREEWQLPTDASRGPGLDLASAGPPLRSVTPAGTGEGATWVVELCDQDSGFLGDLEAYPAATVLPGVRLPELPDFLRRAEADAGWPRLLLALRTALGEQETDLARALARCQEHGVERLARVSPAGSWADMRAALGAAWPALSRQPARQVAAKARVSLAPHVVQLATCRDWSRGRFECHYHDQWFLFDDLWAGAHPDLARSLLRCGLRWDPLGEEAEAR